MENVIPMSTPPMPTHATLPNPSAPWMVRKEVFQRVQPVNYNELYIKCEPPEWVQSYFATRPTETIGTLLNKVLEYLDHPEVQQNPGLATLLETKSHVLFSLHTASLLDPENLTFYQKIIRLLDATGKIRPIVAKQLIASQIATSPPPLQYQPNLVQALSPSISLQPASIIPAIAFGAEKWNKYFGDVGVEPPLPLNIENILNSPCLFWPNKKVYETHGFFLAPAAVDGKPLTPNSFQELIQKPKEGYSTQYRSYDDYVKNELGNQSTASRWVLMLLDIIPGGQNKSSEDQKKLIRTYAQSSGRPYELLKALDAIIGIGIKYVQTGTKHYGDSPLTFTQCQEKVGNNQWSVAIGGMTDNGLGVNYNDWDDNNTYHGVGVSWKF